MKNSQTKFSLKQIAKKTTAFVSALLIGVSTTVPITTQSLVKAQEKSSIVASHNNENLNYIKFTDGSALKFPIIRTNNGKYAFCLEHNKKTPSKVTYNAGGQLDNGITYILKNGIGNPNSPYLLGNENFDYYITQSALKIYLGTNNGGVNDKYMTHSTGDNRILALSRQLANDARNRANVQTRINASITPAQQDFHLQGDYFQTNSFTINVDGAYTGYQVLMKGNSPDVEVINATNGQVMTNQQIQPNTPFFLRIHKSKATQNLNITLGARVWYTTSLAENYLPVNNLYQRIALLKDYPTHQDNEDFARATLQAIGDIKIVKTSEDGKVAGIGFNVQGNGVNTNVTTTENGEILVPNLTVGNYTVTELTPAPYISTQPQTITVNAGQTATVTFNNVLKRGNVVLFKVDEETKASLTGAVFELYQDVNQNNSIDEQDVLIGNLEENNNEYSYKNLLYGNYLIKEVKAPHQHVLDKNVYPFSITEDGQTITITNNNDNTFTNKVQKGHLKLTKFGEVFENADFRQTEFGIMYQPIYNKKGLLETTYTIYADEDIYTADGTLRHTKGDVVDTITTDEHGQAKTKELYIGKYKGVESTASENFVRNPDTFDFEIKYAGQEIEISPDVEMQFENNRQKLEIELTKDLEVDSVFNIGLGDEYKNVYFGLFARDNIVDDFGNIAIEKDSLVAVSNLDDNKKAHFEISAHGKYYVKEIATDEHYILNDTKYDVDFVYENQDIPVIKVAINDGKPIENKLKLGSVELFKTDKDTKEPINKKAQFNLYEDKNNDGKADKDEFIKSLEQLDNKFFADNLPTNTPMLIVEHKAPSGYNKDTNVYPFIIKEDKEVVTISNNDNGTFENAKKIGKVFFDNNNNNSTTGGLVNTSDKTNILVLSTLALVSMATTMFFIFKKHKKDKTE